MLKPEQIESLRPRAMTLQIICGALTMGVVVATSLLFLVLGKPLNADLLPLPMIGVAAAAMAASMAFFLPVKVRSQAVKGLAAEKAKPEDLPVRLFASYQTSKIIGYALLEGPAFLNAIGFLLEASLLCLGAVVVIVALMLMGFPTTGRTMNRIESMMEDYHAIRSGR